MKPTFRNILAVIAGLVVGGALNLSLILVGNSVVPSPEGIDVTSMESLEASMHLFEPKHFLFPFLAHALGTLAGALTAALIAPNHKMGFALAMGALFMLGGITNAFMLPAPAWFIAVDLILAYIPMAWIAGGLANRKSVVSAD